MDKLKLSESIQNNIQNGLSLSEAKRILSQYLPDIIKLENELIEKDLSLAIDQKNLTWLLDQKRSFEEENIELKQQIDKLKDEKKELIGVVNYFINSSCFNCPDGTEKYNEIECRGCGIVTYIELLERIKQLLKN